MLVVGLLSPRSMLLPTMLLSPLLRVSVRVWDIAMQLSNRRLRDRQLRVGGLRCITDAINRHCIYDAAAGHCHTGAHGVG